MTEESFESAPVGGEALSEPVPEPGRDRGVVGPRPPGRQPPGQPGALIGPAARIVPDRAARQPGEIVRPRDGLVHRAVVAVPRTGWVRGSGRRAGPPPADAAPGRPTPDAGTSTASGRSGRAPGRQGVHPGRPAPSARGHRRKAGPWCSPESTLRARRRCRRPRRGTRTSRDRASSSARRRRNSARRTARRDRGRRRDAGRGSARGSRFRPSSPRSPRRSAGSSHHHRNRGPPVATDAGPTLSGRADPGGEGFSLAQATPRVDGWVSPHI